MYKLIEVANSHGGDFQYLCDLIEAFSDQTENTGIKFQPFSFDKISTQDFKWYPVYKDLFFSADQWRLAIKKAAKTKDVWIDLFDTYGVEIAKSNIDFIKGVKFQTSVLYNCEVFESIKTLDLCSKNIILNVAGRSLDQIDSIVARFQSVLAPKDLWIEVGFQGYPTSLEDSGISKINVISQRYHKKVVFADHVDANSDHAHWLPVFALAAGAFAIEKHVMLGDRETKYDYFSSLTPEQFAKLAQTLSEYHNLIHADFISKKEIIYLNESEMIPILNKDIAKGAIVNPAADFIFRRTAQIGLTSSQILDEQSNRSILCVDKRKGQTLIRSDLKRSKIACIVACRLKSSRLKKKALLKIGNLSSVEYCIKNALRLADVDEVILATSSLDQDALLAKYCYSDNVVFFQGSADDVLDRYLAVARMRDLDIVVRITADMPFVDNEIFQILLDSHFKNAADYTAAIRAAPGTNLEIINANALAKVKRYFPIARYSEYMTWYFRNNPEHFRLNMVDLPAELVRSFRLTLDYSEDLELFNNIDSHFGSAGLIDFSIRDVFGYLDQNPMVAGLNSHLELKYEADHDLIALLNRETKFPRH